MIGLFVLRPLGFLSLGVGLITLPTPIPIGAVLIAVGLVLLIYSSKRVAGLVRLLRRRYHRLDDGLRFIEDRVDHRIASILQRTRRRAAAKPVDETAAD